MGNECEYLARPRVAAADPYSAIVPLMAEISPIFVRMDQVEA